jgi:nucleotide-binding universal stress UspA family protein
MNFAAPILIGYDGSDTARRAVREAAEFFGSRPALVVTVWEPGLAYQASAMTADPTGLGPEPVNPAAAQEVDDASKAHADRVAEDGAALAKSLGLQAEALAWPMRAALPTRPSSWRASEMWLQSSSAPGD